MPLPDNGTAWPPKVLRPILNQLGEWDAWYSGDPARLQEWYRSNTARWTPRASQYAGGVTGFLARLWWGRPPAGGEPSEKLHIPVASDLATTSADLLFSEPPQIRPASADDKATAERLEQLTGEGLHATLLRAADVQAALGGVYLRVVWDRDVVPDRPWIAPVHADAAVPEWSYDRLAAVTFWRIVEEGDRVVLRHLERHEPGAILHGLYEGTPDNLGHLIPLTEHSATAGIAPELDDGNVITTGATSLTAVYIPNQMPSRRWRTVAAGAHLGRSDYEGIEPLMDQLDFVWSSWMRDIDLGRGRLVVPQHFLEQKGPGKAAEFNPEQRIFTPVNALPNELGERSITISQFAIRYQEHRDTTETLLEQILRGAGYSAQTFGATGEVVQTATEVQARERRSLITRAKKALYWRPALASILQALLEVDRHVFSKNVTPDRPTVTFQDSVQEDPQRLATTIELLRRAEAASTETLVRMLHPDWEQERVDQEVAGILAESGRAVVDPDRFTGE